MSDKVNYNLEQERLSKTILSNSAITNIDGANKFVPVIRNYQVYLCSLVTWD